MDARRTSLASALLGAAALAAPAGRASAAPLNELSVATGFDSAYDSNVFNGRGPDFVNRISPHASWRLIDPRIKVGAAYDLGVWTYAVGKADNSINHRAVLSIEGRPTRRLTITTSDEFTRAEDPGYLTRIGVVAPQIGIFDNVADATIGYAFARRVYGSLSYTNHLAWFDHFSAAQIAAGLAPLFNGMDHTPQGALLVRITRLDDLRLGFRAQVFDAGPQGESLTQFSLGASYSPTVGWRHQFIREVEIVADAGPLFYQRLDGSSNVPGAPDSGVTWRLGARLRYYAPIWRASLSYTRDLVGATGIGSAIWADYVYAQVGYHYLDRLDLSAGGGFFRNGRAVDQPTAYDGFTADLLADWRVIAYFRVGAYYSLRWQQTGPGAVAPGTAAPPFPNITRNIVGIRLLAVLGADARPPRREVHE
jgi:hypothetical protein